MASGEADPAAEKVEERPSREPMMMENQSKGSPSGTGPNFKPERGEP